MAFEVALAAKSAHSNKAMRYVHYCSESRRIKVTPLWPLLPLVSMCENCSEVCLLLCCICAFLLLFVSSLFVLYVALFILYVPSQSLQFFVSFILGREHIFFLTRVQASVLYVSQLSILVLFNNEQLTTGILIISLKETPATLHRIPIWGACIHDLVLLLTPNQYIISIFEIPLQFYLNECSPGERTS